MVTRLFPFYFRGHLNLIETFCHRCYGTNPIEYRTREELMGASSGGRGGRGGRGRKRGGAAKTKFKMIALGEGKRGERWAGLSHRMEPIKKSNTDYGWMDKKDMGMKQESGKSEDRNSQFTIYSSVLEGNTSSNWSLSEKFWGQRGWTSSTLQGAYVGCPERSDGTPMTHFTSFLVEMKRVGHMTSYGRKKIYSALVVVGNKNGAVGFATGKGSMLRVAIRKAKNSAVNRLEFVPRYQEYTVYHDLKSKYCRTFLEIERKVKGTGLRCHRIINLICQLVGITDIKAKVNGSVNPLNIVRATMKCLTSQQTHQKLANKNNKFVVEFSRDVGYRPIVVAIPQSLDTPEVRANLAAKKLM